MLHTDDKADSTKSIYRNHYCLERQFGRHFSRAFLPYQTSDNHCLVALPRKAKSLTVDLLALTHLEVVAPTVCLLSVRFVLPLNVLCAQTSSWLFEQDLRCRRLCPKWLNAWRFFRFGRSLSARWHGEVDRFHLSLSMLVLLENKAERNDAEIDLA
ncbi:Uncharacterised protein [Vibrio harveyi]|nr:Uncharacterised protein [Vibrio harveyi]